jgi:hypothetical protein
MGHPRPVFHGIRQQTRTSSVEKRVLDDQAPFGLLTIVMVDVGWIHTMSGCTVVDQQSL